MLAIIFFTGCAGGTAPLNTPDNPLPTLLPTRVKTPVLVDEAVPESTAQPNDTGWIAGDPGVELRRIYATVAENLRGPVVVVRLDPQQVHIRVGYRPDRPIALRAWFAAEQPLLAVNAGYFDAEHQSTALVISDGVVSGASYEGFGGMLAIHADGAIELRPLRDTPYDAAESIVQATQSAPMLIFPSGVGANLQEDGKRARRTVVAFDQQGRLLFIVAPSSMFTLSEIENWLIASDLQIDRALNLDGGSSTGMFLVSGELNEAIDSFAGLPIVILINR